MQMASPQLFVRLSLLIAAVCTVFLMIGGSADAGGPEPVLQEHVVVAGESLWDVARAHTAPGEDVRRTIRDIQDASGLSDGSLVPGDILLIPTA